MTGSPIDWALEFEGMVAIFAALFAAIAMTLPLRTWRARLIHGAFTAAVVVGVAVTARGVGARDVSEAGLDAAAAAASLLAERRGFEVSTGFVVEAAAMLDEAGESGVEARRALTTLCARESCAPPAPATAHAIRGLLESVAAKAD